MYYLTCFKPKNKINTLKITLFSKRREMRENVAKIPFFSPNLVNWGGWKKSS